MWLLWYPILTPPKTTVVQHANLKFKKDEKPRLMHPPWIL